MIERITEIAAGTFEEDGYVAGCSIDRVEDTINAGEKKICDFYVIKEGGASIKGVVYSSDHRVKVNTRTFVGHTCRIEYEIDAGDLRNGDVIDGQFSIINSCGEWFIPYHISVTYVHSELVESMKSLENFCDLAKEHWDAALRLCESSEFLTLPFMENARYAALYQALRTTAGRNNLLEEFLIGCGMKLPVTISISDVPEPYVRSEIKSSDYININRDTWGYVQLSVKTDADFIILMKDSITSEDFEYDICTLEYKIDEGRLHSGRNMGHIIIEGVRQRFVINISIDAKGSERDKKSAKYRKSLVQCMKYFIGYHTKQGDAQKNLEALRDEIYEMAPLDEKNVRLILAVAWVSIKKGDIEDAARVLNRVRSNIINEKTTVSAEYCIYYYLCYIAHIGTESLEALLRLLHRCYDETGDSAVFWMLLNVESSWEADPARKIEVIKEKFDEGCHAPWLYMEACRIYTANLELLQELGNFELNCLWFGAREGILPVELSEHICCFAANMRGDIDKLYLKILIKLYDTQSSLAILKAICNVLLKGDMRSSEYFEWYSKGVEQDIRLTKLYEYYIYSMPEDFDGPIPRMVLLYFSYTNTLDIPSKVVIYRNVIKHYASDEQIRTCYAGQIESFTIDQLLKGYIDEGMAELYNNVIYEDMVDRRIAAALPKMLYAASFCCMNKKIRKIVICYEEFNYEQVLVVWNNMAYTVLFSDNFVVVGIDVDGRRYAGLDIKVKPVFENQGLALACKRINPKQEIIKLKENLVLFDRSTRGEMDLYGMLEMLQNDNIRHTFKADIVARLADYYRQRTDRVPEVLLSIDSSLIGFEYRELFIEMLATHEKYQKAFDLMKIYGWKDISDRSLVDTTSRMIVELRFDKNDMLLEMAGDCFIRGCFNQRILEYLLYNYNGDCQMMLDMLRAAIASGCRRYDFTERVLSQLIFIGRYEYLDEVFAVYHEENQKDETVVQAYLAIRSRDYLVRDDVIPELVFNVTEQFVRAGRKIAEVTKLSLCKYYSTLQKLSEEQKNWCYKFVYSYCRSGIVFAFFQKLGRFVKLPDGLEDKIIIEYQTKADSVVVLRTRILPDDDCWKEEMLPHMFEGFFVKVITLLRGEKLEYEIADGECGLAEAGEIELNDDSAGLLGTGRNIMINRLLDAKEKNDLGRVVINAQSYALLNEVTDRIFTLL